MNTETSNEHLETLAGHVFDNDKLVTYKWLSKELHIHVNIAKQILWDFYQKYQNNNNIECTYLLIGHLKEKGMRVEVVKGSNLSEAKEKFSKIISEHVYSVHKPIADLELLATSGSGDTTYSAIKCDACKERTDEEMQLLRWGTTAKKVMENVTNLKSTDLTNSSKAEKNPKATKKNGFNNLFNMVEKSKSSEKLKSSFQESNKDSMKKEKNSVEKIQNLTKKNKNSNSTTKKISPQNNSKKGSLDNFFGKLSSPPKSATEAISSEKKNDNAKKEFTEGKIIKEKKKSHGKKRNRSKETNEVAKKRKRIVMQTDSSDSEIQSDIEMEESVPEIEPEISMKAKSPSPPKVKHENGKRKMLKLINRTYKEGEYIVTKKEHVYVSCSEDEEEKEEIKRKEQKKTEAKMEKVKKKQSTLTNFFKKC
ncbi:PREDICTED: DNA polymerase delta subunit 3-like isoform X2 [Trachymyrmex cornetzi]|uniref:DNA polymerase delta subunit 3-like isoform X2 n=1 Tax=Trachymyrmex cornetzi TaxID=471704 RepID=UPI00084F4213|nr:PREDICTED: DNA polymerase delta subunit 3-like isoform X2 [Trachymyrmex cornetzi]